MSNPTDDVNDFLFSGGSTSAKFDQPGATNAGYIVRVEKQQQRDMDDNNVLLWWDDAKTQPREQIVAQLQTTQRDPAVEDDDGMRALYIKGQMMSAVREALKKVGARLEIGGYLAVTYTHDGEQKKRGYNPPKQYAATYQPAAVAAVNTAIQTAPQQPQQPAYAPPPQQYAPPQQPAYAPPPQQYAPPQQPAYAPPPSAPATSPPAAAAWTPPVTYPAVPQTAAPPAQQPAAPPAASPAPQLTPEQWAALPEQVRNLVAPPQ